MKAAIIGGKLQGLEAVYLAEKAGWEVTVMDAVPNPPASGLCHRFLHTDITTQTNMEKHLQPFDLVIPALENPKALTCLKKYAQCHQTPVLFDFDAYAVTSSKIESDKLLAGIDIPTPVPYPGCAFPVIVKPSEGSGSKGVRIIHDSKQLDSHLATTSGQQIIQKVVHGPSYSLEIMGTPGNYMPLQITELEVDAVFDCKRVLAPGGLSPKLVATFNNIAIRIAQALALKGLMDVEVILENDILRVLEIDARLPSQTPITVYASTGVNMLQQLADRLLLSHEPVCETHAAQRGVILEHIQVNGRALSVTGEHAMASAGPLHLENGFFGADEAITNQSDHHTDWVATLIISAEDRNMAWKKREAVIADIMRFFGLTTYRDQTPDHHQAHEPSQKVKGPVT
jgi:3-methylornithine--L-lysine ligase